MEGGLFREFGIMIKLKCHSMLLVSYDFENVTGANVNQGITLPNGSTSTHNGGLSSLFFARVGGANAADQVAFNIGWGQSFFSATSYLNTGSYYFYLPLTCLY